MTVMKRLPIGIQDFKTVRDKDCYYVDKSMLIAEILENNPLGVTLFTRPRRFGKSLNLSMLDAFFNIEYKGNKWFDELEISRHNEYEIYKNAYPVIMLDFNGLTCMNYNDFESKFKTRMYRLYKKHEDVLGLIDSPGYDKNRISSAYDIVMGDAYVSESLSVLVDGIASHYGKKVVVLIDEYDKPMNDAYGKEYENDVRTLVKDVLTSLLKGNTNVEFAVLTGVMQIAKETIFSGLNNLRVNNVFTKECDEAFGFTNEEVEQMCKDFDHPERYEEAKEWYDGYRFGDADIYNPWSVLNYVDSGFKPGTYWAGTSGNDIIPALLSHAYGVVSEEIGILAKGAHIAKSVDETAAYDALGGSSDSLHSVMVMSGYLRAEPSEMEGKYLLSMPNKEMYEVFAKSILRAFNDNDWLVFDFTDALLKNDVGSLAKCLESLLSSIGIRMTANERTYQAFMLGAMMHLTGRYEITGEMEAGNGFYDIRMRRLKGDNPNAVIEIKRALKDSDDLDDLARKALEQIHSRRYYDGLTGNTFLYGIAIRGKRSSILSETLCADSSIR